MLQSGEPYLQGQHPLCRNPLCRLHGRARVILKDLLKLSYGPGDWSEIVSIWCYDWGRDIQESGHRSCIPGKLTAGYHVKTSWRYRLGDKVTLGGHSLAGSLRERAAWQPKCAPTCRSCCSEALTWRSRCSAASSPLKS